MKIVVGLADRSGCGYLREVLPYSYLKANGHQVSFIGSMTRPFGKEDEQRLLHAQRVTNLPMRELLKQWHQLHLLREVEEADVICIHRQTSADVWETIDWLKGRGKAVVYDMDDDFYHVPPANPAALTFSTGKPATMVCEAFIRMADVFTTSTRPLSELCSKLNPNVIVCPNAIDDRHVARIRPSFTDRPKRDGELRIGWAGTHTHTADMQTIVKPMTRILRKHRHATLTFIGSPLGGLFPSDVHRQIRFEQPTVSNDLEARQVTDYGDNMSPVAYYDKLFATDWDIAIAPLVSNTFNRSKSNVKILEYALCGIATIATRFGPYKDALEEGAAIATAAEDREWEQKLDRLIVDGGLRASYAADNRSWLEDNYVMSKHHSKWEGVVRLAVESARERMVTV